ncbi:hypothetical protein [Ramlibacter sp. AN1133]|uniref:hypothetical protein n=1 Tax=Ramlibacter sp. AN1133 TaxID=3133429 RepID=UPI0030C45CAA
MPFLLVSDEFGVYLGESHQPFFTYWSGIQPAPVDEAPCFDTQDEVAAVIRNWGPQAVPMLVGLRTVPVMPDMVLEGFKYASPEACARAGAPAWLNQRPNVPEPLEVGADGFSGEEEQRWQRPTMN